MNNNLEFLPLLNIKNQYMNNTKISRIVSTKNLPTDEQIEIGLNDNIINCITLWKNPNVLLSQPINQFDNVIMDAFYTSIKLNKFVVTPEFIGKIMSGNIKQKITTKYLSKIIESIEKLVNIRIKIDCTDEINSRKINYDGEKIVYESYLLPLEKIEIYNKNNKKVAYKILKIPALYEYAETVRQIVNIPNELFETQNKFNDTIDAILIKRYVIKRIAQIKNKKNNLNSNKISFYWINKKSKNDKERGLFYELGYTDYNSEKFRKKIKPMINKIVKYTLEKMVEKKYINGFELYRKNGSTNPAEPINGYIILI